MGAVGGRVGGAAGASLEADGAVGASSEAGGAAVPAVVSWLEAGGESPSEVSGADGAAVLSLLRKRAVASASLANSARKATSMGCCA